MEWQPIDTVPKDGTVVDLWAVDHRRGLSMRLSDQSWSDNPAWLAANDGIGWYCSPDWTPTHWMALPPAPPQEDREP